MYQLQYSPRFSPWRYQGSECDCQRFVSLDGPRNGKDRVPWIGGVDRGAPGDIGAVQGDIGERSITQHRIQVFFNFNWAAAWTAAHVIDVYCISDTAAWSHVFRNHNLTLPQDGIRPGGGILLTAGILLVTIGANFIVQYARGSGLDRHLRLKLLAGRRLGQVPNQRVGAAVLGWHGADERHP